MEGILSDMELSDVPRLLILNKWDQVDDELRDILRERCPEALPISAATGEGLGPLSRRIEDSVRWETPTA